MIFSVLLLSVVHGAMEAILDKTANGCLTLSCNGLVVSYAKVDHDTRVEAVCCPLGTTAYQHQGMDLAGSTKSACCAGELRRAGLSDGYSCSTAYIPGVAPNTKDCGYGYSAEPGYWSVGGCPGYHQQLATTLATSATVRCCGGGKCYSRSSKGTCYPTGVSHNQAAQICAADGKQLCSKEQLEGGVCCSTGCSYDPHRIWTSTYNSPPPGHWSVGGCPGRHQHTATTTATSATVRCCSGGTCYSKNSKGACYATGVSYSQAAQICSADGKQLCSKSQLEEGLCCSTGCDYDPHRIWTSTTKSVVETGVELLDRIISAELEA